MNLNPDIRIHWAGAVEVPDDRKWAKTGCDESQYPHEEILKQLGGNTLSIAKLTDRLILAKQMDEEGHSSEENTKLIEVVSEELDTLYSDRECLYRIDAMRELFDAIGPECLKKLPKFKNKTKPKKKPKKRK